nr:MAG TPA: hypothetical protein [Caudoviricetes sp.]
MFANLTAQRWCKRAIPCCSMCFPGVFVALICNYRYFCIKFSDSSG